MPHDGHSPPILIVANAGQWPPSVRYQAHASGETLWITDHSVWITKVGDEDDSSNQSRTSSMDPSGLRATQTSSGVNLHITFPGARPAATLLPSNPQHTRLSYFLGSDPSRWRSDVETFGTATWRDLYAGVALTLTSVDGRLAFVLDGLPSAMSRFRMRVQGGAGGVMSSGDQLSVRTDIGPITLPMVASTGSRLVAGIDDTMVSFEALIAPPRSPAFDVTSSPMASGSLQYGTFLGGTERDEWARVARGPDGSAYVVGRTLSTDFPTTPGAFDPSANGNRDVVVSKLDPTGATLEYSTYLGGLDWDGADAVAIGADGSAYVAGSTWSDDFPITPEAFDRVNGGIDGFVTRLAPSGDALIYSSFLGGTVNEGVNGIALAADGTAYVTGSTRSSNFPTTPGAFDRTANGDDDGYVTVFEPDGSELVYSTYLGGSGIEELNDLILGPDGAAYVTGYTQSTNFPTTPGAFDRTFNGADDVFATRVSDDGTSLIGSTFVGGTDLDFGSAIGVDDAGHVFVAARVYSCDFPTTPEAYDPGCNGGYDAVALRLDAAMAVLDYGTYLGGVDTDQAFDMTVDGEGWATLTGKTESPDFPTTPGAIRTTLGGTGDAFVSRLDPQGRRLAYSTFLGGTDHVVEFGWSIVSAGPGVVTVAGDTESADFPTTPGAFDRTYNGDWDLFVATLQVAKAMHVRSVDAAYQPRGGRYTVAARVRVAWADGAPAAGAKVTVLLTDPDGRMTELTSVTGSQGMVVVSRGVDLPGTYTFMVEQLAKPPAVYDPSANLETSESVTIP